MDMNSILRSEHRPPGMAQKKARDSVQKIPKNIVGNLKSKFESLSNQTGIVEDDEEEYVVVDKQDEKLFEKPENIVDGLERYSGFSSDTDEEFFEIPNQMDDRQLRSLIQELTDTETTYVERLENGIKVYVKVLQNVDQHIFTNVMDSPADIGLHFKHALLNIERIHLFHAKTLLPQLLDCKFDIEKIAKVFLNNLWNDNFYEYVFFVWNTPKLETLTNTYKSLFKEISSLSNHHVGVSDFWYLPFERIRHYCLIFDSLKKLSEKTDNISYVNEAYAEMSGFIKLTDDACFLNNMKDTLVVT